MSLLLAWLVFGKSGVEVLANAPVRMVIVLLDCLDEEIPAPTVFRHWIIFTSSGLLCL